MTSPLSVIQPVILSGGSGTRLWPLSRRQHPKQLLALVGARTMLQSTVLRLKDIVFKGGVNAPVIICNDEHRFVVAQQLRDIGEHAARIVLEPVGRNTAPAATLAALSVFSEESDPLLLVMPADHVIERPHVFHEAILKGCKRAVAGEMVTFGITPSHVETGYGYLKTGNPRGNGALALESFVEKPDHATAASYLRSGQYLWNSGMFLMKASTWLAALRCYQPEMLHACQDAISRGRQDLDFLRIDREAFHQCPSDSIDYAVMEKLSDHNASGIPGTVIPLDAGWSDVGAWDAIWELSPKDESRNAVRGDVSMVDAVDNLVIADHRLVACVGINDLIVVETADAVLVARKDRTQHIKDLVAELGADGRSQVDAHRKVYRPWGYYDSVDAGERFQVKRIVVNPGASLSLQKHYHRAEHWVVVKGQARVTRGDEVLLLSEDQSTYIPLGAVHRLENPGVVPLELIEVQSGAYLGEDDIVRFDDDYGRS